MDLKTAIHSAFTVGIWALLIQFSSPGFAQRFDSFEGGEPRWILVESDCQARLTEHGISRLNPHSGQTCEMLQVNCNYGTLALMAYPIEPSAILDEFNPRIWTRCSSGRIQIGVRVIYPFAEHPVTHGRLSTILWGESYTDTGQWQALKLSDLPKLQSAAELQLTQRFGPDTKFEGAYIDCVVLNIYTGPGTRRVAIDDLELRGMIPMSAVGTPPPANWRERWRWRYQVPSREERYWAAPNRPPTWLQHQGEAFGWIDSMGFTGVLTSRLPSSDWLTEARRNSLAVIAPPPPYPIEYDEEAVQAIKGWMIGAALDKQQTTTARNQAQVVAKLPTSLQKPLIAEALEEYFSFSRLADELIVPSPQPSSSGTTYEKLDWLQRQLDTVQQRSDGWVSLNLRLDPYLVEQIESARKSLQPDMPKHQSVNPTGLRFQAASAVLAGAKGLLFRSNKALQMQDEGDSAVVAALNQLNSELELWGPWILAGQRVQPPATDENWNCAAWSISDSHLMIAQTNLPGTQHCIPATHATPLSFEFSLSSSGEQIFRLTQGSLERVDVEKTPAGLVCNIDHPNPIETFVITSNPVVLRFVRSQLAKSAPNIAASSLEIGTLNLEMAKRVVAARLGNRSVPFAMIDDPLVQALPQAERQIAQGWQALRNRQSLAAIRLANEANNAIQEVLYASYSIAIRNLAQPQSSPFVVTPVALDLHWALAEACSRTEWQVTDLPGSQLAGLDQLYQSGWKQKRRLAEKLNLKVELIPHSEQNAAGLRMAAYAKNQEEGEIAGGYEGSSILVRSSSIPVRAGQLVRVSATARIINHSGVPNSGLLVYDNQLGPGLGQMVRGPTGETFPVELYRWITKDGEFRILAECRGECDIVLETISTSVIEPASNQRNFEMSPHNSLPSGAAMNWENSAAAPAKQISK